MLIPVERSNLSNQVYQQLRDDIIAGAYTPGERLPPERELCDLLGVNRSSVREALKRLEHARLIETRQGAGSVVLDFRFNAGFDLVGHLMMPNGEVNPIALRSVFEFRSLISPEIARLAARRIGPAGLAHLSSIVEAIASCPEGEVHAFQELDFEFHHTMARAGENLALLLILNSVRELYLQFREMFSAVFANNAKTRLLYRRIVESLAAHDEKSSAELCSQLIEQGNQQFWSVGKPIGGGQ